MMQFIATVNWRGPLGARHIETLLIHDCCCVYHARHVAAKLARRWPGARIQQVEPVAPRKRGTDMAARRAQFAATGRNGGGLYG